MCLYLALLVADVPIVCTDYQPDAAPDPVAALEMSQITDLIAGKESLDLVNAAPDAGKGPGCGCPCHQVFPGQDTFVPAKPDTPGKGITPPSLPRRSSPSLGIDLPPQNLT